MKRRDFFAVLGGGIVVLLEEEIYAQETGGPRRGEAVPVGWESRRPSGTRSSMPMESEFGDCR